MQTIGGNAFCVASDRANFNIWIISEEGAAAKAWHTNLQFEAADTALQLHGGAGYMDEYPIARFWRDARAPRIYGGTNEIMKEIVGRTLSAA